MTRRSSCGRRTPGLNSTPPARSRLPVTAPSAQPSHSPTLGAGPIDTPVPVCTATRPAARTSAMRLLDEALVDAAAFGHDRRGERLHQPGQAPRPTPGRRSSARKAVSAAPAAEHRPHQPGQQRRVRPRPQRQVDVGQPGRLRRPGVGHDDRPAPGPQAAQRHEGVGPGHGVAVGHDRVLAHHEQQPGRVPVGLTGNRNGAPAIRSGTRVLLGASTVTAEYSWLVGSARKNRSATARPVVSKAQCVAR